MFDLALLDTMHCPVARGRFASAGSPHGLYMGLPFDAGTARPRWRSKLLAPIGGKASSWESSKTSMENPTAWLSLAQGEST